MIEKVKNISNKKIVIISITIMIIVLVLGFTYAYWTRTFTQSGVNRNTYDCFDINFTEKVEGITIENGYPVTDEEGMQSAAYEVEIINTCNIPASYNVVLNKLNTSTLDSSHIKIAVDNNIKLLSETENTSSTIENAIEGRIINSGVLPGKESKTLQVRSWMDEATTIEEGSNKVFENKITIEAVAGKNNLLAAHILTEKLQDKTPDFSKEFPTTLTYKENIFKDSSQAYRASVAGNRVLGNSYSIKDNGTYKLEETMSNQTFNQDAIGKYYCAMGTADGCNKMIKIKEISLNSDQSNFRQTTNANKTVSLSGSGKVVGSSFNFDSSIGKYNLENTVSNVTYDNSHVGYYTCNNASDSCTVMYKINTVTNNAITNADQYNRIINNNDVVKSDVYTVIPATGEAGSGLYKSLDDDGTTFYYRGNIENNYVAFGKYKTNQSIYLLPYSNGLVFGEVFNSRDAAVSYCTEDNGYENFEYASVDDCINNIKEVLHNVNDPIIWRIVRVNGDGTIRLIKDDALYTEQFNSSSSTNDYVGYTYNNNYSCTKNSPCYKETGTSSKVKTNLENWYDSTLNGYDNKIAISNYCSDTKVDLETDYFFGTKNRLFKAPSFKCADTNRNYGGFYKLKIGLLTAEEANLAGLKDYKYISSTTDNNVRLNYLNQDYAWWTMTPYRASGLPMNYIVYAGNITDTDVDAFGGIRPVINLKEDVKITSGNGTKDNPYVIE